MAQTIVQEQGVLDLEIGAVGARCELAQADRLTHWRETKADLEALLAHWNDPLRRPNVPQPKAWLQSAWEQQ